MSNGLKYTEWVLFLLEYPIVYHFILILSTQYLFLLDYVVWDSECNAAGCAWHRMLWPDCKYYLMEWQGCQESPLRAPPRRMCCWRGCVLRQGWLVLEETPPQDCRFVLTPLRGNCEDQDNSGDVCHLTALNQCLNVLSDLRRIRIGNLC